MSAALVVSILAWVPVCVLAFLAFFLLTNDDLSLGGALCAGAAVLCGVFAIVFPAVVFGSRSVGATTCRNWGNQVGVPTEFRILNWADTGTCFARTPGGRWIPSDGWFSYVRGDK